jgi:hypothetical protein
MTYRRPMDGVLCNAQVIEIVDILLPGADREKSDADRVDDRCASHRADRGMQCARLSATYKRRSAIESSITPSEEIPPPSNAAQTFLPWTARNLKSGIVLSVAAVAGAKARTGLA